MCTVEMECPRALPCQAAHLFRSRLIPLEGSQWLLHSAKG